MNRYETTLNLLIVIPNEYVFVIIQCESDVKFLFIFYNFILLQLIVVLWLLSALSASYHL